MFNFEVKDEYDESRTGVLKLGLKEIKTPSYGLIHTDTKRLINGSNLLNARLPQVNFNEIVIDHKGLIRTDTFLSRIKRNVKTGTINICQFRTSNDVLLSKEQLLEIVKIQSESEKLSVITVPEPFTRIYDHTWEESMISALDLAKISYETGITYTIMPTISLNQSNEIIEKKIKWLLNKDINSIGLRATGQFSPRLIRATQLINQHKTPIWVHLFDIKKKYLEISQVHLIPLVTVDTISTKKGYPRTGYERTKLIDSQSSDFLVPLGIPLQSNKAFIKRKQEQRDIFESRALGFLSKDERIKAYGHKLSCSCPICAKTRSIEDLEGLLSTMDRKSLLEVHEVVSYENEFSKIKKAIHDNDLLRYYNHKSLVRKKKELISKKYPNLTKPRFRKLW